MNSITCEIIQDLLPLYCDEVCSEESRALVETHLKHCEKCSESLRQMNHREEADSKAEATELDIAASAAKIWKQNKRLAFRRGVLLCLIIMLLSGVICTVFYLGSHYNNSCFAEDLTGLQSAIQADLSNPETQGRSVIVGPIENTVQSGRYLAAICRDELGLWVVSIFRPDTVFSNRYVTCGNLSRVRPGHLVNWNFNDNGDTVLFCFGIELSEDIVGYTFTNSGITYSCPVENRFFADFFFITDTYDADTTLDAVYRTLEEH